MKKILIVLNSMKLFKYSLMKESSKIAYLKKIRSSIIEKNKVSKVLEDTGDLQRSFLYSGMAWLQMSEYCMYCEKEGLDVRQTFKKQNG